MKINRVLYLIVMLGLIAMSCSPNYKNITVMGYVKDDQSLSPITNAKVEVAYWIYNSKLSESERFSREISTDNNGYFSVSLEEAEAVDLLVEAPNYISEEKSYTIRSSKVEDVFFLKHKVR